MNIRSCAIVLALVLAGGAAPAEAGQGASEVCDDDIAAGTEVPLVHNPITFDLEGGITGTTYLQVCYSTTAYGSDAPAVTGGMIQVDVGRGRVVCVPDSSSIVVAVTCSTDDADPASAGSQVTVTVRIQEDTTTVPVGAEAGVPGSPACLRGFTVFGPTGQVGPFNVGIC
jgi:hypothetical protein